MSIAKSTTAAQSTAARPDISAWVTANAGAGKTRVLIDRILRLLLDGTPPNRILCLTFTKAAAAEMEIRLSERLSDWAARDTETVASDVRELVGGETLDAGTLAKARRLFADTVEAPDGLKIRTIHSFCESLLGRFPLEAGIAPHFQVADDRTAAELLIAARDYVLLRAQQPAERDLAAALATLLARLSDQGFAEFVGDMAANRAKVRRVLATNGGALGAACAGRAALGVGTDDTAETALAEACREGAFDGPALRCAAQALVHGKTTDRERGQIVLAWLDAAPETRASALVQPYFSAFVTNDGTGRKVLITNDTRDRAPEAVDALKAERERLVQHVNFCRAIETAEATTALLHFAEAFLAAFEAMKADAQLLDYDDLILKARELLGQDGGISWVHYKLDGGIDHILVDEAQDTSPEQWEVIRLLADDFFSGEGARARVRTVFSVGDPKQSIYSFQGADPEAFARMRDYFARRVTEAGGEWKSLPLELSFRSTPTVLAAVDDVFASAEAHAGLEPDGKPVHHRSNREGHAGLVELWPTEAADRADVPDAWDAPFDRVSAAAPAARLARRVADTIARWIADKELLPSLGRPIRAGDVMVLVPKRGPFVDELIRNLKRDRVPVAGADRLLLANHIAVMDLMATARVALLPDDDLTLAAVLKSPLIGLDDDALISLAPGRTGSLWRALEEQSAANPAFAQAFRTLSALRATADFKPPFEFFSNLLGPSGGRRRLLGRLGPDAADPIDELLALALAFEREHVPSLEGFLHWLNAGATEIKRDPEVARDEVRVMTAHGAKGLQANIVILPDTARPRDVRKESRLFWTETAELPVLLWGASSATRDDAVCRGLRERARTRLDDEHRRLLYVAMTRARDRLYITGFETGNGARAGCWYDLMKTGIERAGTSATGADGSLLWRRESPQTAKPDTDRRGPAPETPVGLASPPPAWTRSLAPHEPTPPRPLAPSAPAESQPPVRSPIGEASDRAFARGRIMHRLFQFLPDVEPGRRRNATARWLAQAAAAFPPAEQDEMLDGVLAVLDDPAFAPVFGPGSRAEVPIVGLIGDVAISGQVDRLVVGSEGIWVVDFKTNRLAPGRLEDVPDMYYRQMAAYGAILHSIYPYKTLKTFILWTDGPTLMEIQPKPAGAVIA